VSKGNEYIIKNRIIQQYKLYNPIKMCQTGMTISYYAHCTPFWIRRIRIVEKLNGRNYGAMALIIYNYTPCPASYFKQTVLSPTDGSLIQQLSQVRNSNTFGNKLTTKSVPTDYFPRFFSNGPPPLGLVNKKSIPK
jgi:hypothetical protein